METPEHIKSHLPKLALTREEAAEALGVSAITVDRLAKRKLLRPSRATRRPLYPVWEIERFLRETTTSLSA
ncbi:MAG: helix-turn-helix domain-containing protein [Nibricoccus sp.]